jgi:hypothetical protein
MRSSSGSPGPGQYNAPSEFGAYNLPRRMLGKKAFMQVRDILNKSVGV